MKKRVWLIASSALVVLLALMTLGVGFYMCDYVLRPEEHGQQIERDRVKIARRYPGMLEWYDSLHQAGVFRDTVIVGEGGYRLHAVYASAAASPTSPNVSSRAQALENPAPVPTALLVHGYTDNHLCFLNIARMYRDSLHCNVLIPDLHYHGLSEGRAIQMGWLDRLDIKHFAALAHALWPESSVVVHGVSMGAAATMMFSGEPDLPDYIKGFVEDCGYTSVWDQFAHNLKREFGLPPFPVMYASSWACKMKYGWSFKEASCLKQLSKSTRPMLFIHGNQDDFVPFDFFEKLYDAKTQGYKEKWVTEGTKHARSHIDYPLEYQNRLGAFIKHFCSL
jgi:fermentation-respiration switch protein FrsA (DUF1100 family)